MKFIKTFYFLIMLLMSINSQCSSGCLSCIMDVCHLCDMSQFFFNDGSGKCVQNVMANCEVPSLNFESNQCYQCSQGYFLDQTFLKCLEVPSTIYDDNCLHYSMTLECLQCGPTFMVSDGKCVNVNSLIPNCVYQIDDSTCALCDDGSYLNVSNSACVEFETTENCQLHQEFECKKCGDGFNLSVNKMTLQNMTDASLHQKLSLMSPRVTRANEPLEVCSHKYDEKCVSYNSYGKCQSCIQGYHVNINTSKCQVNQQSPIFKCKKYAGAETCAECMEGYYLNQNSCQLRQTSPSNCEELSLTSEGCAKCKKRYYEKNSNCVIRDNSYQIEFCDEYKNDEDVCESCLYDMFLSLDKLKCFAPIQFCEDHTNVTKDEEIKCAKCSKNAIPLPDSSNTTQCQLRMNPNCIEYENDNEMACKTCAYGHYLNDDKNCNAHTKMCKEYNPAADNCSQCKSTQYMTTMAECKDLTVFNCKDYVNNESKCSECHENYYIDPVSFDCVPYDLVNCKEEFDDKNECKTCNDGFYKSDAITCLKYDLQGCDENKYVADSNSCESDGCLSGYYYESNSSKCVPQTLVGCAVIDMSKTDETCNGNCLPGFYKNTDDNKCYSVTVENCSTPKSDSNECESDGCYDGYYYSSGKCIQENETWCENFDENGVCTECIDGFKLVDDKCSVQYQLGCKEYFDKISDKCKLCHNIYKTINFTCTLNEIIGCKTYGPSNQCMECKEGFIRRNDKTMCHKKDQVACTNYNELNGNCLAVDDDQFYYIDTDAKLKLYPNCMVPHETEDKCKTCMGGYYLNTSTDICIEKAQKNCIEYDESTDGECSKCENLFYVNGASCTLIADQNCKRSDGVNNQCVACLPNYITDGSSVCAATSMTNTDFCEENTSTDTNVSCTKCVENALKMTTTGRLVELPIGCMFSGETIDPPYLETNCAKLLPGWEYADSKIRKASEDSVCLQLNDLVTIDTANKCETCRNIETHYLTSNTCTLRVNSLNKCSIYEEDSDECVVCPEGLSLTGSENTDKNCTAPLKDPSTDTSNCKLTEGGENKCYQCEDGYIVDENGACIQFDENISAHLNCRKLSQSDQCSSCFDGFYPNSDNDCQATNCWVFDGSCDICNEGFIYKDSLSFCYPKEKEDSCKYYGYLNGKFRCLKCQNENQIPYTPVVEVSTINTLKSVCIDAPPFMKDTLTTISSGFLEIFKFDVSLLNRLDMTEFVSRYTQTILNIQIGGFTATNSDNPNSNKENKNFCIDMTVQNCLIYDNTADPFSNCTRCEDGYYLSSVLNKPYCKKGGITGCAKYTDEKTCETCMQQYKKNSNACDKLDYIPNCEIYDPDNFGCKKCYDNFVLSNKECREMNNMNCQLYSLTLNRCIVCQSNYYVSGERCQPRTILNCENYAPWYDLCHTCMDGFFLKDDGLCEINSKQNCKVKSKVKDVCLVCEDGYYKDSTSGDCKRHSDSDCIVPNPEGPTCLACKSDFYLSENNQCLRHNIKNCISYSGLTNSCLKCSDQYFVNSLGGCLKRSTENCLKPHPTANLCLNCMKGYFLDSLGRCKIYSVQNCSSFNPTENECLSCLPSFYKDPSSNCMKYTNISNCINVDPNQDKCLDCVSGFFLTGGECVSYTVSKCDIYKPDADVCVSCQPGYFLMENHCIHSSLNCATYNQYKNECLTCNEGDYMVNKICQANTASFCLEKSTISNSCLSCESAFYLEKGNCIIRNKSTNCAEAMRTADLCVSCDKEHYLAENMCIPYERELCAEFDSTKDLCTSCIENKAWLSHGICEEYTISHCEKFSPTADECLECVKGTYFLNENNVCEKNSLVEKCSVYRNDVDECAECEDEFYLLEPTSCVKNPDGDFKCINYSPQGNCVLCQTGFYLNAANKCERSSTEIKSCLQYSADAVCEVCEDGHLLVEYEEPSDQVETDDGVSFVGLTKPEKVCVSISEQSCATWAAIDSCQSCDSNKVLVENQETSKMVCEDSGLTNCNVAEKEGDKNVCKECSPGYLQRENDEGEVTCQEPLNKVEGCVDYESEGICKMCQDGKTLAASKTGCIDSYSLMTENCSVGQEYSSPICKMCQDGYQLNDSNECEKCGGDGCAICDPYDSNLCLVCLPSFEHNEMVCTKSSNVQQNSSESEESTNANRFKSIMALQVLTVLNFVLVLLN